MIDEMKNYYSKELLEQIKNTTPEEIEGIGKNIDEMCKRKRYQIKEQLNEITNPFHVNKAEFDRDRIIEAYPEVVTTELISKFNEETNEYVCEQLMKLNIDKDVLVKQTKEIQRLNSKVQQLSNANETLIEAIRSVVWYNGLHYDLLILADEIKDCSTSIYKKPYWFNNRIIENNQYEFIWIMLVEMYGDCGTSPRSGWIEDKEGAYNFIQKIIKWEKGKRNKDG